MNVSTLRGFAVPCSQRGTFLVRALVFGILLISRAFAQMVLISEERSVFASYYGGGIETYSSAGNFGLFEAFARGTPQGGGSVYAYQKSNITASEITIVHNTYDGYGPGGVALTNFEVRFALLQDTRITITGYSNEWSGITSLVSDSLGAIPLVWGPPSNLYRNYLDFDEILGAGIYTFSSMEYLRENWRTTIELRASAVPDLGSSAIFLTLAAGMMAVVRSRSFRADRLKGRKIW